MDRVKGLRRATAAVVLVVASALFVSCSHDDGVVNGRSSTILNPGDIFGVVSGPYGAIEAATVTWVCDDCNAVLGSDYTDEDGSYFIDSSSWSSAHENHKLVGTAVKAGYQNGYAEIPSYDPDYNYRKDFYLEPAR